MEMQSSEPLQTLRSSGFNWRRWRWFLLAAFMAFFAWSSIDTNSKVPLDDWKHDLRADASGYYIYLPGFFHHGMRAAGVTDSLRAAVGLGFTIDREHDRLITKYTCGPAILMLPFFLIAEGITGWGATDGWSRTHHQAIEAGAIIYWSLGLYLLITALWRRRRTAPFVAALALGAIAFGTNTFYYAYRAAGYSHVYSFFAVCVAIHAVYADRGAVMRPAMRWLFLFACAFIVLIRPVDVVAVIALLGMLYLQHRSELRSPGFYLGGLIAGLIVVAPQLIYWKFAHGHWIVYSYGDEGFSNWASPWIAEVLIAPMNGLLPHAPALFLLPFGAVALWREDKRLAALLSVSILLILYSFAAWHAWAFGCGYGMRPFVQYTPFAALMIWFLLARLHERRPPLFWGLAPLLVLVCSVNYRAMLQYGTCYVWDAWDWLPYGRNLWEAFFGRFPS